MVRDLWSKRRKRRRQHASAAGPEVTPEFQDEQLEPDWKRHRGELPPPQGYDCRGIPPPPPWHTRMPHGLETDSAPAEDNGCAHECTYGENADGMEEYASRVMLAMETAMNSMCQTVETLKASLTREHPQSNRDGY